MKQEKIFANYTYGKGLILKINKEFKLLNNEKITLLKSRPYDYLNRCRESF